MLPANRGLKLVVPRRHKGRVMMPALLLPVHPRRRVPVLHFVLPLLLTLVILGSSRFVGAQMSPMMSERVDALFEVIAEVPTGYGVCLSGDLPELGSGDVTKALHMIPTANNKWWLVVSVPRRTPFHYRFGRRNLAANQLPSAANWVPVGDSQELYIQPFRDPRRMVSLAAPTPFTSVEVINHRGQVHTQQLLAPAGGRMAAMGLPFIRGESLRFTGPGVASVSILTDSPHLYASSNAQEATWHLPAGQALAAPRYVLHTGFFSPQMNNSRTIRVYLPRGYDQQPQRRYPVVYFFDG